MEYGYLHRRKSVCSNCGKSGHEFKSCNEPITSFGIINIKILEDHNESLILKDKFSTKKQTHYKIMSKKYPEVKCYISDNIKLYEDQQNTYKLDNESIPYDEEDHIHKFRYYRDKIMFAMVSRRFSLGFIEFIRGKYNVFDAKTIINLFEQMYEDEIKFISSNPYDNILYYFLNRENESKESVLNKIYEGKYSNEYCEAKVKFNMLKNPKSLKNSGNGSSGSSSITTSTGIQWDLDFYIRYIKPKWKLPEWGFPKGRRDKKTEENLNCACREFQEETGYRKEDYTVLNKIEPIEERMTGTNGVSYKHVYYLSVNELELESEAQGLDEYDMFEIGSRKWFTYDEAMANIRPYHIEKKQVLTRIYLFLMNYLVHNTHDV